eukprot:CAMPEP_0182442210 /NCGR_PEP_ID=MMETSP1172-20130603/1146_1 /TAXON_ID=708627 /ORGANISM="Timspurckia oligopyrenoides, Strain CCMP3278" /LENGTH=555 /DNA_ID=CAMNT_0024636945 /DNA_START=251 /DNA_END=1918 /DNA_ORIENTATION=-
MEIPWGDREVAPGRRTGELGFGFGSFSQFKQNNEVTPESEPEAPSLFHSLSRDELASAIGRTPSRSDILGLPFPLNETPKSAMPPESLPGMGTSYGFSSRAPVRDARQVLRTNDRGGYCVPTDGLYPFQWNWDAAFTALGWATWKPDRAWQELEMLFRGQWEDGMVPSIVFHKEDPRYFPGPSVWQAPPSRRAEEDTDADDDAPAKESLPQTTGITQPPVVASCVRVMVEQQRLNEKSMRKALELLPKIVKFHNWFFTARDANNTGRVSIHHPWESGMDNSPAWDSALDNVVVSPDLPYYERKDTTHVDSDMRPTQLQYDRFITLVLSFKDVDYDPELCSKTSQFRVADVCINALLLRANKDLLWLCSKLLSETSVLRIDADTVQYIQKTIKQLHAWIEKGNQGLDSMWSEKLGMYCAFDENTGALVEVSTSASFLAWYAGHASAERSKRLAGVLEEWLAAVSYGVPSINPRDELHFDSRRYWRGPVWLVVNWMIAQGLERYELYELAERVRRDSHQLITNSEFYEYFDPITGYGCGGANFSWTAAMQLVWFPDL